MADVKITHHADGTDTLIVDGVNLSWSALPDWSLIRSGQELLLRVEIAVDTLNEETA